MIVKENIEIGSKEFVKQYSDQNVYIERDGAKYSEAIDPSELGRTYTETDIPIEIDSKSETDLTVNDTLDMLSELGVDTDD